MMKQLGLNSAEEKAQNHIQTLNNDSSSTNKKIRAAEELSRLFYKDSKKPGLRVGELITAESPLTFIDHMDDTNPAIRRSMLNYLSSGVWGGDPTANKKLLNDIAIHNGIARLIGLLILNDSDKYIIHHTLTLLGYLADAHVDYSKAIQASGVISNVMLFLSDDFLSISATFTVNNIIKQAKDDSLQKENITKQMIQDINNTNGVQLLIDAFRRNVKGMSIYGTDVLCFLANDSDSRALIAACEGIDLFYQLLQAHDQEKNDFSRNRKLTITIEALRQFARYPEFHGLLAGINQTHIYALNTLKNRLRSQGNQAHMQAGIDEIITACKLTLNQPKQTILLPKNKKQIVSSTEPSHKQTPALIPQDRTITLAEFQLMTQQLEQLKPLTLADMSTLYKRLATDKAAESVFLEQQWILSNPNQAHYYQAMQTHFSELMVASLGIGSGYIEVKNSQASQVIGWICMAVSSAFPGASVATAVIQGGVSYLDKQYRQAFLSKVRVLGATVHEAEVLGEEVARFLVRAHVHAGTSLSAQKAEQDIVTLIRCILTAETPMVQNEPIALKLFQAIWGDSAYCIDPLLPTEVNHRPKPPRPPPPPPKTNTSTQISTSSTASLEQTQLKQQALLEQLQSKIEHLAPKHDVDRLAKKISALGDSPQNGGGQILMKPNQNDSQTESIRDKQRLASLESHVHETTAAILILQENNKEYEQKIAELESSLTPKKKTLPTSIMFFSNGPGLNNRNHKKKTEQEPPNTTNTTVSLFGFGKNST